MATSSPKVRGFRSFVGTTLVGLLAVAMLAREARFAYHARASTGVVRNALGPAGRSLVTLADVVHDAGGRPVLARLRVWLHRLKAGESIPILYRPDSPAEVALDDFWQLHFASVASLLILVAVAIGETMTCRNQLHMAKVADIYRSRD